MESLSPQEARLRYGVATPSGQGPLAVVGAGPKALATAAKSQVLRELGIDAPRVVVIEPYEVGANWTATGGRTNGRPRLSTSPEKDLGFPYSSAVYCELSAEVNARMQEFSWSCFLVSTGQYAAWVDAGRPNPRHSVWAAYLQWAAERIDFTLVGGWVRRLDAAGDRWEITVEGSRGGAATLHADRVLISGPGPQESLLAGEVVCGVEEFWRLGLDSALPDPSVAVIGGGETAAAVVEQLVQQHRGATTVISPHPVVWSRGEGYFENALYSSPDRWRMLSERDRREVISRTDRGVYSPKAIDAIATEALVEHRQGTVVAAKRANRQTELTLRNLDQGEQTLRFDVVIDATGARPDWFLELLGDGPRKALDALVSDEVAAGSRDTTEALEGLIGEDLALRGLSPKLVLPTLAGYAQGPGFANLSSLGLLSDRVLDAATTAPALTPAPASPRPTIRKDDETV